MLTICLALKVVAEFLRLEVSRQKAVLKDRGHSQVPCVLSSLYWSFGVALSPSSDQLSSLRSAAELVQSWSLR